MTNSQTDFGIASTYLCQTPISYLFLNFHKFRGIYITFINFSRVTSNVYKILGKVETSTIFIYKNINEVYWISPDHIILNQIDHVLVDKQMHSNVINVR